jgi:hypothetical protein
MSDIFRLEYVRRYNEKKLEWYLYDIFCQPMPVLALRNLNDYNERAHPHSTLTWRNDRNLRRAASLTVRLLKGWQAFRGGPKGTAKRVAREVRKALPQSVLDFQAQMLELGVHRLRDLRPGSRRLRETLFAIASAVTGCVHGNNTVACDDNNACTDGDLCVNGVCAGGPGANAPAAINDSVRVDKLPIGAMIKWGDIPGPYNVYRGGKGSSGPWLYNQSSLSNQSGVPIASANDTDVPPTNHFFYYLITRVNATSCESPLGTDSSGLQRPNATPSPMPPRDTDGDGVPDYRDNCPTAVNQNQADGDNDGVGEVCDNCAVISNSDQSDIDGDRLGDECDPDIDGDGVLNAVDNCPYTYNPDQLDTSGNGIGDACNELARARLR